MQPLRALGIQCFVEVRFKGRPFSLRVRALTKPERDVLTGRSYYMPTDPEFIPTGEFEAVQGTPFDFLEPHAVGERIGQVTFPPPYGGYDHNYVLFGLSGSEAEAEADNTCVLPFGCAPLSFTKLVMIACLGCTCTGRCTQRL